MKVKLIRNKKGKIVSMLVTLENTNTIVIDEFDEHTIELRNIVAGDHLPGYSLSISPINGSTIQITPEG